MPFEAASPAAEIASSAAGSEPQRSAPASSVVDIPFQDLAVAERRLQQCAVPYGLVAWTAPSKLRSELLEAFRRFPFTFTDRKGVAVEGKPESVTGWSSHPVYGEFWKLFVRPLLGWLPPGGVYVTWNRNRPWPGNPSVPRHPDDNFAFSYLYVDGSFGGGRFRADVDMPDMPLGVFLPFIGAIPHWVEEVHWGCRFSQQALPQLQGHPAFLMPDLQCTPGSPSC